MDPGCETKCPSLLCILLPPFLPDDQFGAESPPLLSQTASLSRYSNRMVANKKRSHLDKITGTRPSRHDR
jgi:hypothetical protein